VQAFSLHKNVPALFSLSRSPDDIECLHGIRAISVLFVLLSHKAVALSYYPYLNRTAMVEVNVIFVGELIVTLQMYKNTE
jgi:hypothetical protein